MNDSRDFGNWEDAHPEGMMGWSEGRLRECQRVSRNELICGWAQTELARRLHLDLRSDVQSLEESSKRLEVLTKVLKNLTWVLIFLTVAVVIVPIGIEIWKAHHEPEPPKVPAIQE